MAYYSNLQPYSLQIKTSSMYGGGTWIINNSTTYWVSFRKSDQSGIIFAVAPPNAKRVQIPITIGENYDYIPHFYKELKYNGKVIALVESDDTRSADTVVVTEAQPSFTTDVGGTGFTPPNTGTKPAIFLTNNSDKTIRVYQGQNNQLGNGSSGSADFALASGNSQLFTGFDAGINTNSINFASIAWAQRKSVTQDIVMAKDKVYHIVLAGNQTQDYTTSVTEEEESEYFN
jgi:hypothetical protein